MPASALSKAERMYIESAEDTWVEQLSARSMGGLASFLRRVASMTCQEVWRNCT